MSKSDPTLANRRAARNRAKAEFNRELGQAKVDLAPAVLKRRVVDEAKQTALSVTHQAMDIANDSRGVVAVTGATLVLWIARKPLFAGACKLVERYQARRSVPKTIGDRVKLLRADAWHKLKEYADD